ncbi:Glycerol-3-phosphate dehydrogenase [NAD(P)+] [BD1-7 clade bacterium]|uniref:Glycerol-3-phosphate dehydrogenase [NAD(P)+] n=1 Tax=BD1-7 clade bacterium TaxID=2029982 RepID=A0A5S9QIZ5_9GAMM|nr:Glycerol-3-phosphate dehydrogenase [NAD(P)+] [BD1-7 clade bacterium]CAA0120444.1 Glycerol-3-phosphate dehydrogenase [NAD(P)+] [BD1-7 clade bacterium]
MQKRCEVAVLGGGSFGTAIANLIAGNGHNVCLWLRNQKTADEINQQHANSQYLPNLELDSALRASVELGEAVRNADYVFVAVPSKSYREVAQQLKLCIPSHASLVSLTKGIEADTFDLMSQILAQEMPHNVIGVMSGPNLAKEIADRHLTATVIASESSNLVHDVQELLHTSYFRVYASSDMFGVELGGALKNCYAIICGMASALGSGQNTIGMLITRSLAEMSRFAVQLGADPMTFLGLSGVGDLIVTCMSPLSRNYRVGYALGSGQSMDEIVEELGQVAEGVNTLRLVRDRAQQLEVYMPLVNGMCSILHEGQSVESVVSGLMEAEQNTDVEFTVRN